MKQARNITLTLTEAEATAIWIALDVLEGKYRASRRAIRAGNTDKFTGDLARAARGIRETHNLKRRVGNAKWRTPGKGIAP